MLYSLYSTEDFALFINARQRRAGRVGVGRVLFRCCSRGVHVLFMGIMNQQVAINVFYLKSYFLKCFLFRERGLLGADCMSWASPS